MCVTNPRPDEIVGHAVRIFREDPPDEELECYYFVTSEDRWFCLSFLGLDEQEGWLFLDDAKTVASNPKLKERARVIGNWKLDRNGELKVATVFKYEGFGLLLTDGSCLFAEDGFDSAHCYWDGLGVLEGYAPDDYWTGEQIPDAQWKELLTLD